MVNLKSLKLISVLVGSLIAASANAAIISYKLSDKAVGVANPPDYGLRIDGLFGEFNSKWTFSFNSTDVWMDVDTTAGTAHIFGEVIGAKDVGTNWNPVNGYSWYLDFTYTDITITDPAAGFWHAADVGSATNNRNLLNQGSLRLLSDVDVDGAYGGNDGSDKDEYIAFTDYKGGDFYNDSTKGPYVSAWLANTSGFVDDLSGLGVDDFSRYGACCKDFGFQADVPEPAPLLLFGSMLLGLGLVRRVKKG